MLAAYEEKLPPRSAAAAAQSAHSGTALFAEDAPRAVLDLFTARVRPTHPRSHRP
ncbi:hypothetical protein [Streptomyces sp. NPDC017435]|uniref:hypothetical protein n=1 Tax=Streptomyces sp. NPDC017435 TaxID=3364995 RepID=UPI0037B00300